jgi:hypothetical protein
LYNLIYFNSNIYKKSMFIQEGEEVEYELNVENNGRQSAANVTGPNGDYVQGAPPPRNSFDDNSYNGY